MRVRAALALAFMLGACKPSSSPPHARPALWEVTGKLGEKAWLFGTIHALPERVDWRSPPIDSALASADELVLEIAAIDDQAALEATFARLARTPGQPALLDRLPPAKRASAERLLRAHGVDPDQFGSVETWAAALIVARQLANDTDPKYGIDKEILDASKDKPVGEFEGATSQFAVFDTLPEADQRDLLLATLDEAAAPEAEDSKVAEAWARGDMAEIETETKTGLLSDPELRDALLIRRNRDWAGKLTKRLQAGERPFVAVGAAHMAGPEGLPALMAAQGYVVRRVQ
jgi:uncharacterized protein